MTICQSKIGLYHPADGRQQVARGHSPYGDTVNTSAIMAVVDDATLNRGDDRAALNIFSWFLAPP